MKPEYFDAVVIGSGAGGAPVAARLSAAGWHVLLLERGPEHAREAYRPDELAILREGFFTAGSDPHVVTTARTPNGIFSDLGWTALCVGGGTVHMGGFLYRFHPSDFSMASDHPGHAGLADWPYGYAALEPYYVEAEREMGVSGDGDATYVARSAPHPMPALRSHRLSKRLAETCRVRGMHPFATPRSINSIPYQNRPACRYCDACSGYGCPYGAKGSAQETFVRRAVASGRCTLRSGVVATELLMAGPDRIGSVVYAECASGRRVRVEAGLVCVSCSAVESARLLLASQGGHHPYGLGNDHGLVGRNLQFHGTSFGNARLDRGDHDKDWNPFLNISIADHYRMQVEGSAIRKGGMLRFDMAPRLPMQRAMELLSLSEKPLLGRALKDALRAELHDSIRVEFEAFHDYLPREDTWIGLDPSRVDRFGMPLARIHLGQCAHQKQAGRQLSDIALGLLREMGADTPLLPAVGGTSKYLVHGTCRAGHDPEHSVLDPWCRVHGVDNLFVVDGSFMPTSGGASPTLTIVANALRVADHMLGNVRTG